MPNLSPETDNLLFLNQQKREINFPVKNMPDVRVALRTACIKADMLPTKLLHPVHSSCEKSRLVKSGNVHIILFVLSSETR